MNSSFDKCWEGKYSNEAFYRNHYPWSFIVSHTLGSLKKNNIGRRLKILEIGCGTANNLMFLAKEGFDVYGIDGSATAINYAESWAKQEGVEIDLTTGDFSKLPYENNYFDFVFDRAALSLSNYEGIKRTISEIHRVINTTGEVFLNPYSDHCTSFYKTPDDDGTVCSIEYGTVLGATGQVTFLGLGELKKILKNSWTIKSLKHVTETEMATPHREVHAEWHVILEPIK
jgi:ubiquinone/menaquinone biosynthesis C-methylase UbiE